MHIKQLALFDFEAFIAARNNDQKEFIGRLARVHAADQLPSIRCDPAGQVDKLEANFLQPLG